MQDIKLLPYIQTLTLLRISNRYYHLFREGFVPQYQNNKSCRRWMLKRRIIEILIDYITKNNKRLFGFGDKKNLPLCMDDLKEMAIKMNTDPEYFNRHFSQLFETVRWNIQEPHKLILMKICDAHISAHLAINHKSKNQKINEYKERILWQTIQVEFNITIQANVFFNRGYLKYTYEKLCSTIKRPRNNPEPIANIKPKAPPQIQLQSPIIVPLIQTQQQLPKYQTQQSPMPSQRYFELQFCNMLEEYISTIQ